MDVIAYQFPGKWSQSNIILLNEDQEHFLHNVKTSADLYKDKPLAEAKLPIHIRLKSL